VAESLRALVLRQVDYGEADRMVSLLSAERGRIETRVPRVRSSRKRFGGLDLYVLAEFEMDERRGRTSLRSAHVLDGWLGIRGSIERLALAAYAAELLVQAVPEDAPAPDAFRLAEAAFASLDLGEGVDDPGQGWARAFELKLLHVLGCRPSLRQCVACGGPTAGLELGWSVQEGGVLAGDCARAAGARAASPRVIERLDQCLHLPLSRQGEVPWSGDEASEARELMGPFVTDQVGGRARARRFLDQVVDGVLAVALCALFLVVGCAPAAAPSEVLVQGFLYGERAPEEESEAISGSEVSAWSDADELLVEGSEPFSGYPGFYRFTPLPPDTSVHLQFASPGEDYVTTIISGRTAVDDLYVDPGTFHLFGRAEALSWVSHWHEAAAGKIVSEAPTFDAAFAGEGGLLRGALASPADHVGTRLVVIDAAGTETEVWYTDDEGAALRGPGTSSEGGFALYGLEPGPLRLRVIAPDGSAAAELFVTRTVEDAVTSLFDFEVL
jgi:DNA repair protein RecO (recombination protein O)